MGVKFFIKKIRIPKDISEITGGCKYDFLFFAEDGYVYRMTSLLMMAILTNDNIADVLKTSAKVESPYAVVASELDVDVYLTWNYDTDFVGGYYNDKDGNKVDVPDKDIILVGFDDGQVVIYELDCIRMLIKGYLDSIQYVPLEVWAETYSKSVPAAKRQCQLGHVPKAVKVAGVWFVPKYAQYPSRQAGEADVDTDSLTLDVGESLTLDQS